jgi:hypothetical protein
MIARRALSESTFYVDPLMPPLHAMRPGRCQGVPRPPTAASNTSTTDSSELQAYAERLAMIGGAVAPKRPHAFKPCRYAPNAMRAPDHPQPSLVPGMAMGHASTHLQLEQAHIGQLGMREWDGANRQCAEDGDGCNREGNRHQGAAERHPVEHRSGKCIHRDGDDPGLKRKRAAGCGAKPGQSGRGQVGPTVTLFVADGKELVARTERRGISARLVNEFAPWLASDYFGGTQSKSAVARPEWSATDGRRKMTPKSVEHGCQAP